MGAGVEEWPPPERMARYEARGAPCARYRPPDALPTAMPRALSKREAYVAVLRSWAGATARPYTATSYERWRGSTTAAPTRNTLASFFGSWQGALAAAGLPTDGTRRPD